MEHSPENTARALGRCSAQPGCFGRSRQRSAPRTAHTPSTGVRYTIGRMNREVWTPCPDWRRSARSCGALPRPRRRQMPPANVWRRCLRMPLSRAGSLAARCKATTR